MTHIDQLQRSSRTINQKDEAVNTSV